MQDHDAFAYEHGISTLVPYIERHFPEAELVAICYRGEPPVSLPMADRLADALAPWFRGTAGEENFLLISADFAHHGTVEGTMLKDKRTRRFFDNPGMGTWDLAGCDNRPGIYAVASLGGTSQRSVVLYHSDSYRLSGQAEDDITSYFFAWFIKAPEKGS